MCTLVVAPLIAAMSADASSPGSTMIFTAEVYERPGGGPVSGFGAPSGSVLLSPPDEDPSLPDEPSVPGFPMLPLLELPPPSTPGTVSSTVEWLLHAAAARDTASNDARRCGRRFDSKGTSKGAFLARERHCAC